MENKYNVGEPVAVYMWVTGIRLKNGELVYNLSVKDADGDEIDRLVCIPEDLITTVF